LVKVYINVSFDCQYGDGDGDDDGEHPYRELDVRLYGSFIVAVKRFL
jgi:hypothetical protein